MKAVRSVIRYMMTFAVLATSVACVDDDGTTIPDEVLVQLVVSPKQGELTAIGDSLVLKANSIDLRGSQLGPVAQLGSPEWRSLNPNIATVESNGVVRATANGTASIVVSAGGKVDTATIVVHQQPVEVTLSPTEARLVSLGDTIRLQADVTDRNGVPIIGLPVYWQSVDPLLGSVDAKGLVVVRKQGLLRVQARISSQIGDAQIEIDQEVADLTLSADSAAQPVGTLLALTANPVDALGVTVEDAEVVWSTSDSNIAVVSETGVVTALTEGNARITAESETRTKSATVEVRRRDADRPATTASVTITPSSSTMIVGSVQQFSATVKDAQGFTLAGRTVTWSSSNSAVASVSSSGLVNSLSAGTANIIATSDGKSGIATVTVSAFVAPPPPPPPAQVAIVLVEPASAVLMVDDRLQLAAQVRDSNGDVMSGQTITWSSSAPNIASVNSNGRVTGVAAGSAIIAATVGGKSGSVSITVNTTPPTAAQVGSVTVTPGNASMAPGATVSLSASVKDTNGSLLAGQNVTWASSASAIASVAPDGLVTARTAGSATISASAAGKTGSSTVTVAVPPPTSAPVATVTISAPAASLTAGSTMQLSATVKDTNGATMTGQSVTWSTSAPGIATVTANGLVTGVGAGSVTITATSSGKTGTAAITVTTVAAPPPPAPTGVSTITVSPATGNVTAGNNMQLVATARDANGATVTGVSFTWSSSNTGIATVSSTGSVHGVAVGAATITVSASGKSTTVVVNVSSPPLTLGGLAFQDNFDLGKYTTQTGGWWVGGNSGNVYVGAGGQGGSPFALSMTHRAKPANQMSTAEQRFRLAQGASEIWIEYDFMVPVNFFHRMSTNNNNKFLALWEENYTGVAADGVTPTPLLAFEFRPMNDSPNRTGEVGSSYLYLHGEDRTGKMHGGLGNKWLSAFGSWNRGKWLKIRIHVRLATNDTTDDGLVELFADGILVISAPNLPFHSSASGHYFRNGYLLGWSNSGYDVDTEFKVDNIKLFTSNPGW